VRLAGQDPLLKQTTLDRRSVILAFLCRSASSHCELCLPSVLLENPRTTTSLFTICLVVHWAARSPLGFVSTKRNKQMSWYIRRKYQSQIQPNNLSGASVGIMWPSSHAFFQLFYVVCIYFFSSVSLKTSK
jgi:hypothetical protein